MQKKVTSSLICSDWHCFEYILNTSLYPVITQSFICYDYDDSDRKEKEIVTFYDNQREGENTWHELTEPSVPVSDRNDQIASVSEI